MKLIFALGNPESKYDGTRHNVGFFVADQIALEQKLKWQAKTEFKANKQRIAEGKEPVTKAYKERKEAEKREGLQPLQ